MKTILRALLLLPAVLIIWSCGSMLPPEESSIVVEGWIEEGRCPVVILTRSVPLSEEYVDVSELSQYVVNWGKVTVSDGDTTIVLTGMRDSKYSPPYIYTTGMMTGVTGKTYTLTVDYEDYHATAQTTIPKSVPIDSIRISPLEGNDESYRLYASFTDPSQSHDYYLVFVCDSVSDSQYMLGYMGCIDDAMYTKSVIEVPVYRGQRFVDDANYTPYFRKAEHVSIKLAHVDKSAYDFWNDMQNNTSFSGNMFTPVTSNVHSNIEGGIGCWYGMGSSVMGVAVSPSTGK